MCPTNPIYYNQSTTKLEKYRNINAKNTHFTEHHINHRQIEQYFNKKFTIELNHDKNIKFSALQANSYDNKNY